MLREVKPRIGVRPDGSQANVLGARKRGRPPGSKNKPKTVISLTALRDLRNKIGPYLPADDLNYLTGVLEGTAKPDLEKDLDIFLALQLKALLPVMADEIRTATLSREATARSSTIKELLSLRVQREKFARGEEAPNTLTFIQNVFQSRGIDAERIYKLVGPGSDNVASGEQTSPLVGDVYRDEGEADDLGAVSGELPERYEQVPAGGEE